MSRNDKRKPPPQTFEEKSMNEMVVNLEQCESKENLGLSGRYDEQVRPLIDVIDALRAIGVDKDIDLPTIAVMGDQSSGKSSVLEAISGVPLPRGAEIVTRCPLEMRLQKSTSPWTAEIRFTSGGSETKWKLQSKDEVGPKIQKATEKLAGPGGDVSDQLITMSVRSPECPDLTLIDLPGIVHSVEKNQPGHLIGCIKSLIKKYMAQERTIMLCMQPANMEIANCEVFQMANEFDPKGNRTIAIVTKPDLVGDREHKMRVCRRITEGGVYNVRQFYIVKARSPEELREELPWKDLFRREAEFFALDQQYRHIPQDKRGFPSLVNALTKHLISTIQNSIPGLRTTIQEMIKDAQSRLETLPPPPPQDDQEKIHNLTTSFDSFTKCVRESLLRGVKECEWASSLRENKDKRWFDDKDAPSMFAVWHTSFGHFMDAIVAHTEAKLQVDGDWSHEKLKAFLTHHRGEALTLFSNYDAYKELIVGHLSYYEDAANQCMNIVVADLKSFIAIKAESHFRSLPTLSEEVTELCSALIEKFTKTASDRIKHIFAMEKLAYCQDRSFYELLAKEPLTQVQAQVQAQAQAQQANRHYNNNAANQAVPITQESERNIELEVPKMQRNLKTYFKATNSRIGDYIPATLRITFHIEFSNALAIELLSSTTRLVTQEVFAEKDFYKDTRTALLDRLNRLKSGQRKLTRIHLHNVDT